MPRKPQFNGICQCGHDHNSHHTPSLSHNYSAGKCAKCHCQYFVMGDGKVAPARVDRHHKIASEICAIVFASMGGKQPELSDPEYLNIVNQVISYVSYLYDDRLVRGATPPLEGEPIFAIRAKDNFAIPALRLLTPIYNIEREVLERFAAWRVQNPDKCKDPD